MCSSATGSMCLPPHHGLARPGEATACIHILSLGTPPQGSLSFTSPVPLGPCFPWPSVAGPDVGVVVFYHVDRRLFRGGRSAIDTDVMRDQTGLDVRVGSLVLCHQPARPGIRAVIEQELVIEVPGRIRLLF